ncbi:competence type IV pilus assembly protein ComGB [Bacillus sp. M6-12]|uniref:competence type IV pilus assembly protein ComGB n=1 Tax=Bacillus sp. M6-12 TaxID=2054166 RepID=UPI0015E0C05A|nr:competence type IV pilus assembly protein ComGB [Bacillus sp. M6-12]
MKKKPKWNVKSQGQFLLDLGELLDQGYPLLHALQFIGLQLPPKKEFVITEAIVLLRSGEPLHKVLHTIGFHPQLISFIFYAEQYGNLAYALKEGGTFWSRRSSELEKMKKLLLYPMFLIVFVGNVFFILQKMLLPKFETLFQSMDAETSIFLRLISAASAVLPYLPAVFLLLFFLFYMLKTCWFSKLSSLKQRLILLNIPVAGAFIRLYDTHFFSSQFSGLLSGGLSINESISLFAQNSRQPFYQELCLEIRSELAEGRALEDIFRSLPYFEKHISVIVANGQKYGRLDKELMHYSRYLLKGLEERTSAGLRIIQPILFSAVGLLIVSIYLAVLMPMFSLLNEL